MAFRFDKWKSCSLGLADCSSRKLPDLSSATAADLTLHTQYSRCAEVVTRQERGCGPIWQPLCVSLDTGGKQKLQLQTCILETFSGRKTTNALVLDYIKGQPYLRPYGDVSQ